MSRHPLQLLPPYEPGRIGGWSMAIPRSTKGVSDEAFEFVRWMCASREGTTALGTKMLQFPAYSKSPYFETIGDDPHLSVFYEIVKNSQHVRTLMPAQGYLMDLLKRGVEEAMYGGRGGRDAKTILDEVTVKTQKRLEHLMSRRARRTADAGTMGGGAIPSETRPSGSDFACERKRMLFVPDISVPSVSLPNGRVPSKRDVSLPHDRVPDKRDVSLPHDHVPDKRDGSLPHGRVSDGREEG